MVEVEGYTLCGSTLDTGSGDGTPALYLEKLCRYLTR
jgi:hypothetical protein